MILTIKRTPSRVRVYIKKGINMFTKEKLNYKHKISYSDFVHVKNKKGQWASGCVNFDFNKNIKKTCNSKKLCLVLEGEICQYYREGVGSTNPMT